MCLGTNLPLLKIKEVAMHKAILQSSVQMPTVPDLGSRILH